MRTNLLLLVLILALFTCGQAQQWRTIVPLKSTRADVEALLGRRETDYFATYHLKEGNIFIEYSSGPCRPERKGGWNVPENVVVSLAFYPRSKQRISALKLNPKKFRKAIDPHLPPVVYYINEQDGVVYEVQDGRVNSVEYGPRKEQEHLHCGDGSNKPQFERAVRHIRGETVDGF
jgi:hypothetical protein